MKVSLLVSSGKVEGKVIPITVAQFLIGRDPQCHLRPNSQVISKRHCAVVLRAGRVFVQDMDSTNGTFVNDEPVKGERELKHDDRLKVGPLAFVVHLESASVPVDKQTPMPKKAENMDEDAVGDLLLAMQDDSDPESKTNLAAVDAVAAESTVLDMTKLPPDETGKPPVKKVTPAPPPADKSGGDTRKAAEQILSQYARRNRK